MIALLAAAVVAAAPIASSPPTDRERHLVGLARVWGYVKYVHPAMATTDLDWDAALVRALPAVEDATTDEAYRRAIAGLLAELHDPATRVVEPEAAPAAPAGLPQALRLEAIDARTAVLVVPSDASVQSAPGLESDLCARFAEAARRERLVVDLRGPGVERMGWPLLGAFAKCAGKLIGEDVAIAPAQYLTHGFYPMQSVAGGAGGGLGPWESGVTVVAAGSIRGEAARTPRLVFVVNRATVDVYALLMALQDRGLAAVVQEGDVPPAGVWAVPFDAGDGLEIAVRHLQRLRADGGAGFVADAVVPAGPDPAAARDRALALLDAPRTAKPAVARTAFAVGAHIERDYSETPYPDRAHRLLALFRLYNAIEYFFPYRDLMDRPWRETLAEFVPRMVEARDATDYALAVAELAVRIQDSHVTLASPVLDAYFGTHRPDVRVERIEGETVVTTLAPDLARSGVRVGDVVVSVDGEPIAARRARLALYLPASTPGRLDNKVDIQLLLGDPAKPAVVAARGADGRVRTLTAPRRLEGIAPRARPRTGPTHALLPSGFAYVDLERLDRADVAAALATMAQAPGAILDLRGYPNYGARGIVTALARPSAPPAILGGDVRYDGTSGTFSLVESVDRLDAPPNGPAYSGRIVVLADGSSQSAAEYLCMLIQSAGPATVIGSPTSGANGAVTRTILPGGIVVNFTAQSVRFQDGRRLQRVGIVPDIEARPTLAGVRAGRDDVLERAIEVLRTPR